MASAKVREEHGEPEPESDLKVEAEARLVMHGGYR